WVALDGRQLVAEAARLRPHIVILDIGMPLLNGIEAARQIRRSTPETSIIFLTPKSDRTYIQAAVRIGASAYLLKQGAASDLRAAMQEVMQGRYFVSSSIAAAGLSGVFDATVNPSELFGKSLTRRQREILQLVAEGKTAKQIAELLGI